MERYIITGTPGAGKTTIALELRARGYPVVDEAATDIIAHQQRHGCTEPWTDPGFVERIAAVQRQRQDEPPPPGSAVQFYDRSPICTVALTRYIGCRVPEPLAAEVARIQRERWYARRVFFVRPLGFVTPTAARRISYENSLVFERIHAETYRAHGYDLVDVPPAAVAERADLIERCIRAWRT